MRRDLHLLDSPMALIFMMTYWPRILFHLFYILVTAIFLTFMTMGVKTANEAGPIRKMLMNTWFNFTCRMILFICGGILRLDCKNLTSACYKEYLGPDWKPKFDRSAPTLVGNHTSWMDVMMLLHLCPNLSGFVAR
jgi:1-acyl-sn-glycerol-3-phosphate acyltransferase